MERNWQRLGVEIRDARLARAMSQQQLAEAAGVARSTIQNFEQGRTFQRVPSSLAQVARCLGWPEDRAVAILEGRPTGEARPAEALTPSLTRLPMRIAQELASGEVLDTEVIDLTGPNGVRLVIVVKRDGDHGDVDQLKSDLAAWTDFQRSLHGLTG